MPTPIYQIKRCHHGDANTPDKAPPLSPPEPSEEDLFGRPAGVVELEEGALSQNADQSVALRDMTRSSEERSVELSNLSTELRILQEATNLQQNQEMNALVESLDECLTALRSELQDQARAFGELSCQFHEANTKASEAAVTMGDLSGNVLKLSSQVRALQQKVDATDTVSTEATPTMASSSTERCNDLNSELQALPKGTIAHLEAEGCQLTEPELQEVRKATDSRSIDLSRNLEERVLELSSQLDKVMQDMVVGRHGLRTAFDDLSTQIQEGMRSKSFEQSVALGDMSSNLLEMSLQFKTLQQRVDSDSNGSSVDDLRVELCRSCAELRTEMQAVRKAMDSKTTEQDHTIRDLAKTITERHMDLSLQLELIQKGGHSETKEQIGAVSRQFEERCQMTDLRLEEVRNVVDAKSHEQGIALIDVSNVIEDLNSQMKEMKQWRSTGRSVTDHFIV